MAKEALQTNTYSKEALQSSGSTAQFGVARFGSAQFGSVGVTYPKEALSTNSPTKESLPNQIT